MLEGIATFSESENSPYEGRLNDGYFDDYLLASASANRFPSLLEMTFLPFKFPFYDGRYLYGGEFINYLKWKYGEEFFLRLFNNQGSSLFTLFPGPIFPYFGIDDVAKRTFGKSFPALYQEWREEEMRRGKGWHQDGESVTKEGWMVFSPFFFKDKLYYVRTRPKKTGAGKAFWISAIFERDLRTGKEKIVTHLNSSVICPLRLADRKLYYAVLELGRGFSNVTFDGFGFLGVLHQRDLNTGDDLILLKRKIRAFTPLQDGRLIYSCDREHQFGSQLWLFSISEKKEKLLFETNYLVGEIVELDSLVIVSARKDWENWDLYLLDLSSKNFHPLTQTPFSEHALSVASSKLLFTANYGGVYGIYAYDIQDGKFYRLTDGSYAAQPSLDSSQGLLYYVGLSADGEDLYRTETKFIPVTLPRENHSEQSSDLSRVQLGRGGYEQVLKTLWPAVHIPIIFPADSTLKKWFTGACLVGGDVLGEHNYTLLYANNPSTEEQQLFFYYQSLFFRPTILDFEFDYQNYSLVDFSYPLFQRLKEGPSAVWVSLSGEVYNEDWSRRALAPSLFLLFRYPELKAFVDFVSACETKSWGSSVERLGFGLGIGVEKFLGFGEMDLSAMGIHDPDNPDSAKLSIRGYSEALKSVAGGRGTLEYFFPLAKLRKGLWNPNLYVEDLGGSIFLDIAVSKDGLTRYAVGTELQLETSGFFLDALRFIPRVGFCVNREGLFTVYGGIRFGSFGGAGLSGRLKPKDFINRKKHSLAQNLIQPPFFPF